MKWWAVPDLIKVTVKCTTVARQLYLGFHVTSQSTHGRWCDMGYTLSSFDSTLGGGGLRPLGAIKTVYPISRVLPCVNYYLYCLDLVQVRKQPRKYLAL